ncbi:MAG: hypothetical protein MAG715_00073 [Methanonatronarchaeales archaeon]|nr:hypothetical protein [Methanonatronarchaeales archaeon]
MGLRNTEQYAEADSGRLEWNGQEKTLWRCIVCNDVHYGSEPPGTCPTCMSTDVYVKSDPQEARQVMLGLDGDVETDEEGLVECWKELAGRNDEFRLNPDTEDVELAARGVHRGEEEHGMKYCPCQMKSGDFVADLGLVCPCNFFIQPSWDEKGECWCKLFVKG